MLSRVKTKRKNSHHKSTNNDYWCSHTTLWLQTVVSNKFQVFMCIFWNNFPCINPLNILKYSEDSDHSCDISLRISKNYGKYQIRVWMSLVLEWAWSPLSLSLRSTKHKWSQGQRRFFTPALRGRTINFSNFRKNKIRQFDLWKRFIQ